MAEENLNTLAEETENPIVSQLNVAGVTYDIASKKLDNVHTIELTGDVTGSVNTDLGSKVELATEIGAGKVGTNELADNAVTTEKINDSAVTLAKVASAAKGQVSASADASKLATCGDVKNYVDGLISGQGAYLGKMTVAQVNALTGLHNSDRVHVTDAGTITDGNISVRADEDLIYYSSGTTHRWDSMDGEFKLKQTAKDSPSASGSTTAFIDSISQDSNGEITATKKNITSGTTSAKGIVQLSSSYSGTDESKAITGKGVKAAIDGLDATATSTDGTNVQVKVTETDGKVSAVNISTDNTENKNNKVTSWSSTTTDTHYPSEKLVKGALDDKQDKLTNTDAQIQDAVTKAHSHSNKAELDKIASGDKAKWDGKQDAISDLATIRSNASNGNTAYNWGNHANAGYASDIDLSNHVGNKNNPHSVTASQVGAYTKAEADAELAKKQNKLTATGSSTKPVYVDANGNVTECGSSLAVNISGRADSLLTQNKAGGLDFDTFVPSVNYSVEYSLNGKYTNGPLGAASNDYLGCLSVRWRNSFPYQFYRNAGGETFVRYSTTYNETTKKWKSWNAWTGVKAASADTANKSLKVNASTAGTGNIVVTSDNETLKQSGIFSTVSDPSNGSQLVIGNKETNRENAIKFYQYVDGSTERTGKLVARNLSAIRTWFLPDVDGTLLPVRTGFVQVGLSNRTDYKYTKLLSVSLSSTSNDGIYGKFKFYYSTSGAITSEFTLTVTADYNSGAIVTDTAYIGVYLENFLGSSSPTEWSSRILARKIDSKTIEIWLDRSSFDAYYTVRIYSMPFMRGDFGYGVNFADLDWIFYNTSVPSSGNVPNSATSLPGTELKKTSYRSYVDIERTADAQNGDFLQIGSKKSFNIVNAKNAWIAGMLQCHASEGTVGVNGWVNCITIKVLDLWQNRSLELLVGGRGKYFGRLHILMNGVDSKKPTISTAIVFYDIGAASGKPNWCYTYNDSNDVRYFSIWGEKSEGWGDIEVLAINGRKGMFEFSYPNSFSTTKPEGAVDIAKRVTVNSVSYDETTHCLTLGGFYS